MNRQNATVILTDFFLYVNLPENLYLTVTIFVEIPVYMYTYISDRQRQIHTSILRRYSFRHHCGIHQAVPQPVTLKLKCWRESAVSTCRRHTAFEIYIRIAERRYNDIGRIKDDDRFRVLYGRAPEMQIAIHKGRILPPRGS